MNRKLVKSLVELVRTEERSREDLRASMSPDASYYKATFHDDPLTNELYLLVLLFMWHELEKEIVLMAALSSAEDASPMTRDGHRQEVKRISKLKPEAKKRAAIEKRLPALDIRAWELLDVLRLLANSFKHNPFGKPNRQLLERLGLPENMNHGTLSESGAVRFGLGKFLGVGDDVSFSEIVDAVRKSCDRILLSLESGTPLRPWAHERVSLNPDTFER